MCMDRIILDGEIHNARVQSVLKYVTEATEMKDETLKVFRRQNVHMMVRWIAYLNSSMCMDRIISTERFIMLVSRVFRNMWLKPEKRRMRIWKSSDDRTYIWWWDECEESMKKRKRSVSTVAQMIGHNCSYVRWSFLYWPISFLFETLSNRRSLVCIFILFNHQCVSESALSLSSHIQCVADVVRYRRFR